MYFRSAIITNPMQNLCTFVAKSLQTLYKIYIFSYRNHYKPNVKSMHFRNEIITNPMQNLCIFIAKSLQTLCKIYTFPQGNHNKPYAKYKSVIEFHILHLNLSPCIVCRNQKIQQRNVLEIQDKYESSKEARFYFIINIYN